jgi:hypothetical protein
LIRRAPCRDGTCIFTSSQSPFPPPSAVSRAMYRMLPATVPPKHWFEFGSKPRPPMRISDARAISFDPRWLSDLDTLVDEIDALQTGTAPVFPSREDWSAKHSWQLAVDGNDTTCWHSRLSVRVGDHFGLDLVPPRVVQRIELIGDRTFSTMLKEGQKKPWQILVAYAVDPTAWVGAQVNSQEQTQCRTGTSRAGRRQPLDEFRLRTGSCPGHGND